MFEFHVLFHSFILILSFSFLSFSFPFSCVNSHAWKICSYDMIWTKNFHSFMICLSFSCLNFMFCFIFIFHSFTFISVVFISIFHAWILMHERSVSMIWYELRPSILSWYVSHFHVWISCSVSFSFSFFRFHFHIHLTYERYAWCYAWHFHLTHFDPWKLRMIAHESWVQYINCNVCLSFLQ